jgi:hypothetical protein
MESVANWGVGRPTTVPEAGASATPSPLNGTYLQRLEEPPLGRDPQQRETLVGVALRQADPYPDASALTVARDRRGHRPPRCGPWAERAGISSGDFSPQPGNTSGSSAGRTSWTTARVRVLIGLTTPEGVPRG